jgi:aminoglycoside phosphotransferase (APT) family kinase protein
MPELTVPALLPVAPEALDRDHLATWIREHVMPFSGPLDVQRFKGGQSNPTYLITIEHKRFVMRRKPSGNLLPSAHAVDREYRIIRALEHTAVPVARPIALCQDESVVGTMFYLMEFVEGRIVWDPLLPGLTPADRRATYEEMIRVLAALHSVDYVELGLGDYGRAGQYIERQVARWTKQYRASETQRIEAMENLISWLPANIPAGDESCIVHGDYRLDNVVLHPSEPRILAVLDWELSTIGHPLADLAYHCMPWRIPRSIFRGFAGVDHASLGIPTEREYVTAYFQRTGRQPVAERDWEYYMAYNMFRIAAIIQGIMARALQGNASNADALQTGRTAVPLAELAWQQVERVIASGRG